MERSYEQTLHFLYCLKTGVSLEHLQYIFGCQKDSIKETCHRLGVQVPQSVKQMEAQWSRRELNDCWTCPRCQYIFPTGFDSHAHVGKLLQSCRRVGCGYMSCVRSLEAHNIDHAIEDLKAIKVNGWPNGGPASRRPSKSRPSPTLSRPPTPSPSPLVLFDHHESWKTTILNRTEDDAADEEALGDEGWTLDPDPT